MSGWYEVLEGREILQGDILADCPIPSLVGLTEWPLPEGANVALDIRLATACVLTQSCDLDNDKVDEVVLGQVVDWPSACARLVEAGRTEVRSTNFRKALVRGNVPGMTLLHKHVDIPVLDWSIIDFHRLFMLPKAVVANVAGAAGKRLRLSSPYREQVGQEFARYFMRVALPLDAKLFETEGRCAEPAP